MKRLVLISIVFLLSLTWLQQNARAQKPAKDAPNFVLIIGDDIGADDIACYGNKEVKTPNIDRLAKEGLRFTNAYVATSSCTPSRASIISGRYPHNTGAAELHTVMPNEIALFPELLQQAGYYTAQAGKWHLGEPPKRAFHKLHLNQKQNGNGGEDMWVTTLQERPKDKPFFLWLAADDAHRPWGENPFSGTHTPDQVTPPPYMANAAPTRADMAKFYDEVTRFDHFIGKVEEELKKQGVLDNTIILVMGDNGRPFPRAKTRVYDSGMRTPFVIKWNKGITKKGAVSESLVSAIDIAPTFLELAGVKSGPNFQGKSFSVLLKNPSQPFRNYVFSEHNWHDLEAMERMVRTKDFLYVLNLRPHLANSDPGTSTTPALKDLQNLRDAGKLTAAQADIFLAPRPQEELFDHRKDPLQLNNVAGQPAYAKKLEELRKVMQQWQTETADTDPGNLTKDWYDRETGKALETKGVRGNMPGGEKAISVTAGGPF
ncbi:sulfatase family protein [Botryobacter ruber]|uniref:sulfatase family protein n=1 Tax=Botryobacter ruber TaxID=2171629 RepID=UPI001F0C434E|nr:sulfatase [Botryobacter ruber]